jgi:hypothetical protein
MAQPAWEAHRVTSRAGYWIGGFLIVAAVLGAVAWGVLSFLSIGDRVDGFARAPAPGSARVSLEAHKYIVYVEGPGVGEDFSPPVQFQVVDSDGDGVLPLADYGGSLTYSMSGHSGRAEATVTPSRAGTYVLRTATSDPGAGYGVALGESIGGRIVRTILGAFGIGGLGIAAGVGLIVTTGLRRRRRGAGPPSASTHAGLAGLAG